VELDDGDTFSVGVRQRLLCYEKLYGVLGTASMYNGGGGGGWIMIDWLGFRV
jgi:hypothetical protein